MAQQLTDPIMLLTRLIENLKKFSKPIFPTLIKNYQKKDLYSSETHGILNMPLQCERNSLIQKKLGIHSKLIFIKLNLSLRKLDSAMIQVGFYYANALAATINKNIQEKSPEETLKLQLFYKIFLHSPQDQALQIVYKTQQVKTLLNTKRMLPSMIILSLRF